MKPIKFENLQAEEEVRDWVKYKDVHPPPTDDFLHAEDEGEDILDSEDEADDAQVPPSRYPILTDSADTPDDVNFLYRERHCILLLLQARKALANLKQEDLARKLFLEALAMENERKGLRHNLNFQEIERALAALPKDDEEDLLSQLLEIRKKVAMAVRANQKAEFDIASTEKKIELLIKNRSSALEVQEAKTDKKKKGDDVQTTEIQNDPRKLELYQELFYVVQAEGRYLATCLFKMEMDAATKLVDFLIPCLFGQSYSPREEFLLLNLFQLAVKKEVESLTNVKQFIESETVVPKFVLMYNKRNQGNEYLKKIMGPLLKKIVDRTDLNIELNPMLLLAALKQKGKLSADAQVAEEAVKIPEVRKALDQQLDELKNIASFIMNGIFSSVDEMPYGLRWMCKVIVQNCQRVLANASLMDVMKIVAYFVLYRYIALTLSLPDKVLDTEIGPLSRKNLVNISKLLINIFNFHCYEVASAPYMVPLNTFIKKSEEEVLAYLQKVIDVAEPEEQLQVSKYVELTQKSRPVIIIPIQEIRNIHRTLQAHLDDIAPDKDDPIRKLLSKLGDPIQVAAEDKRELQLTLTPNSANIKLEEENELMDVYAKTKEMMITLLRMAPPEPSFDRPSVLDIIEDAANTAVATGNTVLKKLSDDLLDNMARLEKEEIITKDDNYDSFLHDVALEVVNRRLVRERQRKEIARLTAIYNELQTHGKFLNNALEKEGDYLTDARYSHFAKGAKKNKKKVRTEGERKGPFTKTMKKMKKLQIISEEEPLSPRTEGTKIQFSSSKLGFIDITVASGTTTVEFEDLLLKINQGETLVHVGDHSFHIKPFVILLNKLFFAK